MKLIGLIISCFLFFVLTARADDTATFNGMLALANKGDAEAQYHVGMMYNNGIGTAQDPKQAFGWFQRSTASHDPLGAYKLGCYYAGQFAGVVTTDHTAALKYKLVAAKAGYSLAQHDVALIYAGQGNYDEAVIWLKQAGEQGYDGALYLLARVYSGGSGVPRDELMAFVYLKLAVQVSNMEYDANSQAMLKDMMANLSEAELAKAQTLIAAWKPQPTALTIRSEGGIAEGEDYLRKVQQ